MKKINYEALKNWLTKNIEDIIDVTFDVPELIPVQEHTEKEIDWVKYIDQDYYADQYWKSKELAELVLALYLRYIDVLDRHFKQKNSSLFQYIRSMTRSGYEVRRFLQALHAYGRDRILDYYDDNYLGFEYDFSILNYQLNPAERDILRKETKSFLAFLPEPSAELRRLFHLTDYGTKAVWWDLDGSFRDTFELNELQLRILFATKSRTTKVWEEPFKNEIIHLYFDYWQIIMDAINDEGGPTPNKARNQFISRLTYSTIQPYEEDRHFYFISSLIKVAENTIRQKQGVRQIKVDSDITNIKKRFNPWVAEKIKAVTEAELAKGQREKEAAAIPERKTIDLNLEKLTSSQKELTQIVDMITDFVGDENVEDELIIEAADVVAEPVEKEQLTDEAAVFIEKGEKDLQVVFIQLIIDKNGLTTREAEAFSLEHGLLLNAFINEINQRLYDLVSDQVVVVEAHQITIDAFYLEEVKAWLSQKGSDQE